MKSFRSLSAAAVLASVLFSPLGYSALINVTGDGSILGNAPNRVGNNNATNTEQWGFNEQQGILLTTDLAVDGGSIPAGTRVDSHMIFLNLRLASQLDSLSTRASWSFSGIILGVMSDNEGTLEAASNSLLGATGTFYPGSFNNRGMENNDRYLGVGTSVLGVRMNVTQPGDWIRVVTRSAAVPDAGSSLALFAMALGALMAFGRRSQR